jgi:hypothetical protein
MFGHRALRTWSPVLTAVLIGCAEDAPVASTAVDTAWPETIIDSGVEWRRSDGFPDTDRDRLAEYAARNASPFDNPLVRGDPTVYSGDAGATRFYWARPAVGGTEWLYLEFSPRGVTTGDGIGPPFPSAGE